MIDLERVMKWTAVFSIVWVAGWIYHIHTVQLIREEVTQFYLDSHNNTTIEDTIEIDDTANPRLDTLAWCLAHTNMKPL